MAAVSTIAPLTRETPPSIGGAAAPEAGRHDKEQGIGPARELETEKKQASSPTLEDVKEIAEALNEYMDDLQTALGFSINEKQVIVEIKNRETDELIKQIPSEELMAIRDKMDELTGLLFDKNV